MSSDSKYIVASSTNAAVYVSRDYGSTWSRVITQAANPPAFVGAAISSLGCVMAAVESQNGRLYISGSAFG